MTINTVLEDYSGETKLKVGSLSGFFYIGTVADFCERTEEVDRELRAILVKKRKERTAAREALLQREVSMNAYARRTNTPTLEGYLVSITKWLEQVRQVSQTVAKAEKAIESYVRLERRNVLKTYHADTAIEGNCVIVILEGSEVGGFWTTGEGKVGSVSVRQEGADDEG